MQARDAPEIARQYFPNMLASSTPLPVAMPPPVPEQQRFEETRWSLISRAGGNDVSAKDAMDELCRHYWYPVYAYVRRSGQSPADAEDLSQDFFGRFFAEGTLRQLDRERGKFRSYVLKAVKNQLISNHLRNHTQRRGGHVTRIPLDQEVAEARFAQPLPTSEASPERLFDREWAVTVVESVLEKLHLEYDQLGKAAFFNSLQEIIQGRPESHFYTDLAKRFEMTENAVRVAAHRLRSRYGKLLKDEVADLLDNPTEEQIREEIRYLFEALTS